MYICFTWLSGANWQALGSPARAWIPASVSIPRIGQANLKGQYHQNHDTRHPRGLGKENPARNVLATDYGLGKSLVLLKYNLLICNHFQATMGGGDRPAVR